jgi:hypothetical protein
LSCENNREVRLRKARLAISLGILLAVLALGFLFPDAIQVLAQQPTGSIATVTGTPEGPTIRVDPSLQQIRVYAGPSSFDYPAIGVMLANESAPALARAEGRDDWIQIRYPGVPGSVGWVYALYVRISPGALLPRIEVPATPTPASTPTIDPTLRSGVPGPTNPHAAANFYATPCA